MCPGPMRFEGFCGGRRIGEKNRMKGDAILSLSGLDERKADVWILDVAPSSHCGFCAVAIAKFFSMTTLGSIAPPNSKWSARSLGVDLPVGSIKVTQPPADGKLSELV